MVVGKRLMGGKRSFRIELKHFGLALEEGSPNHVTFSERGEYHLNTVSIGKEGAQWLGHIMEENIVREGEKAFVRMLCENGKTYVIWQYSNSYGRYLEVMHVKGKWSLRQVN